MLFRKMDYVEDSNEGEKQWLQRIYGKGETDRIIRQANLERKSVKDDKKVKEMRDSLQDDQEYIEEIKQSVAKIFGEVIQDYNFPVNLIEDVCLDGVF